MINDKTRFDYGETSFKDVFPKKTLLWYCL